MIMVNVSPTVQILLDRMDKFPEEFIDPESNMVHHGIDDCIRGSRWQGITESIFTGHTYHVFTAEEVNAYRTKLAGILRKKFEEDVCKGLVKFEEDPRQMELPIKYSLTEHIKEHFKAHKTLIKDSSS
jgi:hypothetical protein